MSDSLKERGRSLEEAFFKKEESKQLEGHRKKLQVNELAEASGLDNTKALAPLVDLGVTADTIAAIALVPLIHVAWADGEMQENERKAILEAADEKGIKNDSPAHQLLDSWLDERPKATLFAAWSEYIGALKDEVDDKALAELKESIASFARDVAKSAGGFLGIKAVSGDEERALDEVEKAFPS